MIFKLGDKSNTIMTIQEWLNELGYMYEANNGEYQALVIDGIFGKKTEDVVLDFQEANGLYADGIVGPITLAALEDAYYDAIKEKDVPSSGLLGDEEFYLERLLADKYREGYNRLQLRNDVAVAYKDIRNKVLKSGAILTSSGGMRSLNASINPSRSAVSFHYLGRALDLYIYSAMVNPEKDPYVVTWDIQEDRYFTVYARCKKDWDVNPRESDFQISLPPEIELKNVMTYKNRKPSASDTVKGRFINLTEVFKDHGFKNIRARKSFFKGGTMLGAEWWHFQYEKGLMPKVSTFGAELLKIYSEETLQGTPPWKQRERIYKINWF